MKKFQLPSDCIESSHIWWPIVCSCTDQLASQPQVLCSPFQLQVIVQVTWWEAPSLQTVKSRMIAITQRTIGEGVQIIAIYFINADRLQTHENITMNLSQSAPISTTHRQHISAIISAICILHIFLYKSKVAMHLHHFTINYGLQQPHHYLWRKFSISKVELMWISV